MGNGVPAGGFSGALRVAPGGPAGIGSRDAGLSFGPWNKENAEDELRSTVKRIAELQYLLYAENRRSLLVVLQAMDAAGKDGVIRNVFSGVNPQGCSVTSFKQPSAEELDHDFLWRIHKACPCRGDIGVFNRSHYEDVLVVRVRKIVPDDVWGARFDQINAFERHLAQNGTRVIKLFLHVSKDEQKKRLDARLADPLKNWKANPGDHEERKLWDEYQSAYEDAMNRCSTAESPWFVVPADKKWFRNLAAAKIVLETLEDMSPKIPR